MQFFAAQVRPGQGPSDVRSITVTSVHPLALEHAAILRAHFGVCGRIVRATVLRDRQTGASPAAAGQCAIADTQPREQEYLRGQRSHVLTTVHVITFGMLVYAGKAAVTAALGSLPQPFRRFMRHGALTHDDAARTQACHQARRTSSTRTFWPRRRRCACRSRCCWTGPCGCEVLRWPAGAFLLCRLVVAGV